MKIPEEQVYDTTINNKVSFSISITTDNTTKTLGISIIIIPNSQVVKSCNLIGQQFFDP